MPASVSVSRTEKKPDLDLSASFFLVFTVISTSQWIFAFIVDLDHNCYVYSAIVAYTCETIPLLFQLNNY